MTYAITGASGFIGSRIVERLKSENHFVFSIKHSLLNTPSRLTTILSEIQPRFIIHAAAYGNHSHQSEPEKIYHANVVKTLNLFLSLKDIDFEGMVVFGSSSEYGYKIKPMAEYHIPETTTHYGASKVAATFMARAFAHQANKPIVTIRPFSVYGPGEDTKRFIPVVCRSLIKGESFTLAPHPVHDWIYIDDFVDGTLKILENARFRKGEVMNLGNGTQTSNGDIVRLLGFISGKEPVYTIAKNLRSYDTDNVWRSNTEKTSILWSPKVPLLEGLEKTYEYYKQTIKA